MAWNIPRQHWKYANSAAKTTRPSLLAEQRYFEEHFSPHLNATMFHLIGQGVTAGSDQISPFYSRRGGGLQIGGLRFKDIVFQRPSQVEGTECGPINDRLLKASSWRGASKRTPSKRSNSSLELFLLAHSETPELDLDSCVMLSAMAFERLLEPTKSNAQAIASDVCGLLGSIFKNNDRGRQAGEAGWKILDRSARLATTSEVDEGTVRGTKRDSTQRRSFRVHPELVAMAALGARRLCLSSDGEVVAG